MSARRLWLPTLLGAVLVLSASALAAVKGKVFFSIEEPKDQSYSALVKQFGKGKPYLEVPRNKEKNWEVYVVALFNAKAAPGPITLWVYDKEDKDSIKHQDPITAKSVDQSSAEKHFIYNLLLEGDLGFNKNRSYLVMVGQIIKGKNKVYAQGELALKE